MSKRLPKYLNKDKVLEVIGEADKQNKIRDWLILRTLWQTGIRNAELRDLTAGDFDLEHRELAVRGGKGAKDRIIPIPKSLKDSMKTYLPNRSDKYVFPVKYGGEWKKMTGENLRRILKKYGDEVDIQFWDSESEEYKPLHPHHFRHSYAVHMLKSGVNLRTIQRCLGHESLTTTQIYLDITAEDVKDEVDRVKFD